MEFKDVIGKRRTIRDFQNNEVPEAIIDYTIENGFKAPTYNHLRDWNFIIVSRLESKLKLIESENLDKSIDLEKLKQLFKDED